MPSPATSIQGKQLELDVSVVVCTRNRAGPLREFLESFADLERPPGITWELLIVDNGSSDMTPDVVAAFSDQLPIRYTREERAGLSNARNHGVAAARGTYICWTDDDVRLERNWLAGYAAAFRRHPEAALFGGPIEPRLEGPSPSWFQRLMHRWPLDGIVAKRDFGDIPVPLDFDTGVLPWGANFAVRTEEQRRFAYDPLLGVSPLQRRSAEETQMMFELLSSGAKGWWVPESRVFHIYPVTRQSRSYFYEHYAAIGETLAYLDDTRPAHCMNRDGRNPRWVNTPALIMAPRVAVTAALYGISRALGLTLRSFYYQRRLAMYAGVAAYRRSRPSAP